MCTHFNYTFKWIPCLCTQVKLPLTLCNKCQKHTLDFLHTLLRIAIDEIQLFSDDQFALLDLHFHLPVDRVDQEVEFGHVEFVGLQCTPVTLPQYVHYVAALDVLFELFVEDLVS